MAVAGRGGVAVEVEGRGHALVVEAARHEWDGDTVAEHLGGHEMPEVVQPERPQPGGGEVPLELLGHPIRQPYAALAGEHRISPIADTGHFCPAAMLCEDGSGAVVDLDAVTASRLRTREDWAGETLDESVAERDPPAVGVDVTPAQAEQLGASRAGGGGEDDEHVEHGVHGGEVIEQRADVGGGRWVWFGVVDHDAMRVAPGLPPSTG